MDSDDASRAEINGDLNPDDHPDLDSPVFTQSAPSDFKSNGNLEEGSIGSPSSAPVKPVKGFGLRKWRRIKRDVAKDGSPGPDLAQIHKRRMQLPGPSRSGRLEEKPKSDAEGESSVASVESRFVGGNTTNYNLNFVAPPVAGSDPDVDLMMAAAGFSIGAVDSDNSDERSSKSSTAASVPRVRYETVGHGRERGRFKGSSSHTIHQRTPRVRGTDGSKKQRGDRIRFEAENSNSSSSNARIVSNGKHSDKSVNYEGENSGDEAQQSEEVRSGFFRENGENLIGDNLDADREEGNENKSENSGNNEPESDPFLESMEFLQTVQEMFESEIQKWTEIGNEPIPSIEETDWTDSPDLESRINELNEKINQLEFKLEQQSLALKEKDSQLHELESHLNQTRLPLQSELDQLLMEKMEAEFNYLVIARTAQTWKRVIEDQVALYEEQKTLALDHKQLIIRLRNTENENIMLKECKEKLEMEKKGLAGKVEVLETKGKACKVSVFYFFQFVLLCFALVFFFLQLLPPSGEIVVPT